MKNNLARDTSKTALAQRELDHATAITALAEAEVALGLAANAYDAALGQGREAALAARRTHVDAEVDRDVARRTVEVLAQRLDAARSDAASAEAEHLANVARERIGEFASAVRRDLKAMTGLARRLARLRAEADLAREAAIRAGVDEADLPGVEDFRNVPGIPGEVIETERVSRWLDPTTSTPLDDARSKLVRGEGRDVFLYGGRDPIRLNNKAVFDRTVTLVAQRGCHAPSVLSAITVPGLMADDEPGWSPPQSLSPRAVLAHLDAIEGAPPPYRSDRRERRVDLRRVPASELAPVEA